MLNDIEIASRCRKVVETGNAAEDEKYHKLLRRVTEDGLFSRTYGFYFVTAMVAFVGLAASIFLLTATENLLIQTLNGVLFGFWSVQLGMVGHDLSHGAVFRTPTRNRFYAVVAWCLLCGLSERRWFEKHNAHHKSPNHEGHDPDLDIPFVNDEVQVKHRSTFFRQYILPYQHILFWITLPAVYFWNIFHSFRHLLRSIDARTITELLLIVMHYVVLAYIVFTLLPFGSAAAFLVANFIICGLYMSLAFAPNHKGEEVLESDKQFSWTLQITQTRNILPSWTAFYLLGGLNFQIEHHLFPTMSRLQYFRAQKYVKEFCTEEGLPYHETSWLGSMREIHESLKEAQHPHT